MSTAAVADFNPAPTSVGLYNFSTVSVSNLAASTIAARNLYRAGLIIQNNGGVSVVIKPGSAPQNATDGIVLTAGTMIQLVPPPVDSIWGLSSGANAKVVLIENVK